MELRKKRISEPEDVITEFIQSEQHIGKVLKKYSYTASPMWRWQKRPNIHIIAIQEAKEEGKCWKVLKEIMAEILNLAKDISPQKSTPRYKIKFLKTKEKGRILKLSNRNGTLTVKEHQFEKQISHLKFLRPEGGGIIFFKRKDIRQLWILHWAKLSFGNEGDIHLLIWFKREVKASLQEWEKEVLQMER